MSKKTVLLRSFKVIFFVLFVFFLFAFSIKDGISAQETKDFVVRERAVIVEENKTPFLYLKSFFSDIGSIFSPESSVPEIFVSDEAYPGSGSQTQTPQQLSGGGGIPICGSGEFNVVEAEKEEAVGIKGFFQKVIRVFFPEPDLPLMLVGENCRYPFSGEGIDKEDDIETPDEAGRQGWDTAKSEGKSDEEARYIAEAAYNNFISNSPNWKENVSPEKVASGRSITDAARLAEIERIKRETGKTDTNMFSAEEVQRVKDAGIISGEREMVRERASRYGIDTSSYTNKEIDDLFIECPDLEGLDRNIVQFEQDKVVRAEVEARAKEQAKIAAIKEVEAQKQEEAGPAWGFTQGGVVKKRVSEPASEGEGGQWFTDEELESEPKSAIELSTEQKLEVESQAGEETGIGGQTETKSEKKIDSSKVTTTGGSFLTSLRRAFSSLIPQKTSEKFDEDPFKPGVGEAKNVEETKPLTMASILNYAGSSLRITKPTEQKAFDYPDGKPQAELEDPDKAPTKTGLASSISRFARTTLGSILPGFGQPTPLQPQPDRPFAEEEQKPQPRDVAAEKGEGAGISAGDITTEVYESPSLSKRIKEIYNNSVLKALGLAKVPEKVDSDAQYEALRGSQLPARETVEEKKETGVDDPDKAQPAEIENPDKAPTDTGPFFKNITNFLGITKSQAPKNQGIEMIYSDEGKKPLTVSVRIGQEGTFQGKEAKIINRTKEGIVVEYQPEGTQQTMQTTLTNREYFDEFEKESREPMSETKSLAGYAQTYFSKPSEAVKQAIQTINVIDYIKRRNDQADSAQVTKSGALEFREGIPTLNTTTAKGEVSYVFNDDGELVKLDEKGKVVAKGTQIAEADKIKDLVVGARELKQIELENEVIEKMFSVSQNLAKESDRTRDYRGYIEELSDFAKQDKQLFKILAEEGDFLERTADFAIARKDFGIVPNVRGTLHGLYSVKEKSNEEDFYRFIGSIDEDNKKDFEQKALFLDLLSSENKLDEIGELVPLYNTYLDLLSSENKLDEIGESLYDTYVDLLEEKRYSVFTNSGLSGEVVKYFENIVVIPKLTDDFRLHTMGGLASKSGGYVEIPNQPEAILHEHSHQWWFKKKDEDPQLKYDLVRDTVTLAKMDPDEDPEHAEAIKFAKEYVYGNDGWSGMFADYGRCNVGGGCIEPEKKANLSNLSEEVIDEEGLINNDEIYAGMVSKSMGNMDFFPDFYAKHFDDLFTGESKYGVSGGFLREGEIDPREPVISEKEIERTLRKNKEKEGVKVEEKVLESDLESSRPSLAANFAGTLTEASKQIGSMPKILLNNYSLFRNRFKDLVGIKSETKETQPQAQDVISGTGQPAPKTVGQTQLPPGESIPYSDYKEKGPTYEHEEYGNERLKALQEQTARNYVGDFKDLGGGRYQTGDGAVYYQQEDGTIRKETARPGFAWTEENSLPDGINITETSPILSEEISLAIERIQKGESLQDLRENYPGYDASEEIESKEETPLVEEKLLVVEQGKDNSSDYYNTLDDWTGTIEKKSTWSEKYRNAETETERFELIRDGYSNLGLAGAGLSTVDNVLSHAEDALGQVPLIGGILGGAPSLLNPRKLGIAELQFREAMKEIAAGESWAEATEDLPGYSKHKLRWTGAINAIQNPDVSIPERFGIVALTVGDTLTMGGIGGYEEAQMKANIRSVESGEDRTYLQQAFETERIMPTVWAGIDIATAIVPLTSRISPVARFVVKKPLTTPVFQKTVEPMLNTGLVKFVNKYTPSVVKKVGVFFKKGLLPEPSEGTLVKIIKKDIGKEALEDGAFKAAVKVGDKETIDQIVRRLTMQEGYPDEKITKEVMEKVVVGLSEQVRGTPEFMALAEKQVIKDMRSNPGFFDEENIKARLKQQGYPEKDLDKGAQKIMEVSDPNVVIREVYQNTPEFQAATRANKTFRSERLESTLKVSEDVMRALKEEGIETVMVPDGTVQKVAGNGNYASFQPGPEGVVQLWVEDHVFYNTETLFNEMVHEYGAHVLSGPQGFGSRQAIPRSDTGRWATHVLDSLIGTGTESEIDQLLKNRQLYWQTIPSGW